MNFITNNTFKKIFSNFTIKKSESLKYDSQIIDFDFELIKKVKDFFKNSENIQITSFHKFNSKNYPNVKEKEYGTYHIKEDCKILKSDFQDIKVPLNLIEIVIAQNKNNNKKVEEIAEILLLMLILPFNLIPNLRK